MPLLTVKHLPGGSEATPSLTMAASSSLNSENLGQELLVWHPESEYYMPP